MIPHFLIDLQHLGDALVQYCTLLGLCSIRLFIILLVFPPTSEIVLQGAIRNGMVLLWSSFIAYGQQALTSRLHGFSLIAIGVKEAVIGLVIGYAAATMFWAADGVGTYIDDLTGYNNVQLTNPTNGQETTLTSTFLVQCVTVAFWLLGGMTFLLGALYESYRWWPLESTTPIMANILETFVMRETDSMMQTVAKLSAPIVMLLILVDLGFAIVGKAAQKLDVQSLAYPVKGALTVLILALLIGVFIDQVRAQLALTDIAAQLQELLGVKR